MDNTTASGLAIVTRSRFDLSTANTTESDKTTTIRTTTTYLTSVPTAITNTESPTSELTSEVDNCQCLSGSRLTFEGGIAIGIGVPMCVYLLHILLVIIFRRKVGKLLLGIKSPKPRKQERFKDTTPNYEMPVAPDVTYDEAGPNTSYSDLESGSRVPVDPNGYYDLSSSGENKRNKKKTNPTPLTDDNHFYELTENSYAKPTVKKKKKEKEKKEKKKNQRCKPPIDIPPTPETEVIYEEAWPNYCDLDNQSRLQLEPKGYYDLHLMKSNVLKGVNKSPKTPGQDLGKFYELEDESKEIFSNIEMRTNKGMRPSVNTTVYEEYDTKLEPMVTYSKPKRQQKPTFYEPVSLDGNKFALYDDATTLVAVNPSDVQILLDDNPSDVKIPLDDNPSDVQIPLDDNSGDVSTAFEDGQTDYIKPCDDVQGDVRTILNDDQNDAKRSFEDDLSDAATTLDNDQTDVKTALDSLPSDVKIPFSENDKTDTTTQSDDNPGDTKIPLDVNPNNTKASLDEDQADTETPLGNYQRDTKASLHDYQRDTKASLHEDQGDVRTPFDKEPSDASKPCDAEPGEQRFGTRTECTENTGDCSVDCSKEMINGRHHKKKTDHETDINTYDNKM